MTPETPIDKNNLLNDAIPYLENIEKRTYEIWKSFDTAAITFIGFIIAASWLIIVSPLANFYVKLFLILAIFSFIIWWIIYLERYKYQQTKLLNYLHDYIELTDTEDQNKLNEKYEKLSKGPKGKNKTNFYFRLATLFRYLWVILFIIWTAWFAFS